MQSFFFRTIFILITLVVSNDLAFASGSYSTGGGGGDANQAYNLGKSAVYKKLACSSCPLAGQEIDAAKATEVIQSLANKPELAEKLSEVEREAVTVYLKRRYELD
ncbi:hypothetical protein U737_12955 [Methylomonas sp. LW13]|uniref:hypothetical protein n=1 Tax=unclassified Methylomonas TaxID=2608980 RepID=UPI00051BABAB|nr:MULTISPECIES: hypothetical protein [unclassified Methylomonas]PKD39645.1 hypothetical protein CWO84_14420 [Methylomonas sp. Kb3]QBC27740.1 hypothetical protein U737_12955 [Methylomonas sp. LW13]